MYSKFNFAPASGESDQSGQQPDCIHLSEQLRCTILRVSVCRGKGCPFCRSAAQEKESQQQWSRKLSAVPVEKQLHIARQYYGGKTPWKTIERNDRNG